MKKKKILNLIGIRCPELLMLIRKEIRSIKIGKKIFIITDDISSKRDIVTFCYFMKHQLIINSTKKIPYYYVIKKGKEKIL